MSITFSFGSGEDAPEINFCNSNAAVILSAMGIAFDWCGSMPGTEFNHRAWSAWAKDDQDLSDLVRPSSVDGNVITFGLDLTGIRERLFRLASMGVPDVVTWG